jgi:hypothetical protein
MCYLSKNLQNTSRFVTLFSAHGDVVVGFHIVLFQNKKTKKERKKGTPPWYVNVGGHPMESVSVTSQDFIKFWGNFFAFVLLEMIGNSQGFKIFESI